MQIEITKENILAALRAKQDYCLSRISEAETYVEGEKLALKKELLSKWYRKFISFSEEKFEKKFKEDSYFLGVSRVFKGYHVSLSGQIDLFEKMPSERFYLSKDEVKKLLDKYDCLDFTCPRYVNTGPR